MKLRGKGYEDRVIVHVVVLHDMNEPLDMLIFFFILFIF